MMRRNRHKLWAFLAKSALGLLLFALVWPWLNPGYHRLVVGATQALFPGLSGIGLHLEQYASYFNLGLLLALLLATPGLGLFRRARLMGIGLIAFFGVHVLTRALILSSFLGLVGSYNGQGYAYSWLWLYAFSAVFQVIAPAALWLGLTGRKGYAWLRPTNDPASSDDLEVVGRDALSAAAVPRDSSSLAGSV